VIGRYSYLLNYLTSPRRFLPVCAGLVLTVLLLAGCQGFNPLDLTPQPGITPSPSPSPAAIPTRTPTRPALTPTPLPTSSLGVTASQLSGLKIRFWHTRAEQLDGGDILETLVSEFNRDNPWGISVDTAQFGSYGEIFQAVQTSLYGQLPDLLVGYNYQAAGLDFSGGRLVDLNLYVEDPVWGLTPAEAGDYYPAFWAQDLVDGKRLGIPFYRSVQLIYYNQTWAEELGFKSPPANAQDFAEQACAAAEAVKAAGVSEGGWAINTDPPSMLGWIYAFGGQVTDQSSPGYAFSSIETGRAIQFLYQLYDQGCAWVAASRYPNQEFASRQALFITGSVSGLPAQVQAFQQAGSGDRWTAIPFPPASESGVTGPALVAYGPSFSVMKTTPEVQLASWLFLRWLVSPENQVRWSHSYAAFPPRESVQDLLADYAALHPQWAAALNLLPYARVEPALPSWGSVRWALSDAGGFLFSPFFSVEQLPDLVQELDRTAAELHRQSR
jgi:multiple sugar transport system substrate-binding protein